MFYFWETRPKVASGENYLEFLNELVLLGIGYTLLLYTDFVYYIEVK